MEAGQQAFPKFSSIRSSEPVASSKEVCDVLIKFLRSEYTKLPAHQRHAYFDDLYELTMTLVTTDRQREDMAFISTASVASLASPDKFDSMKKESLADSPGESQLQTGEAKTIKTEQSTEILSKEERRARKKAKKDAKRERKAQRKEKESKKRKHDST